MSTQELALAGQRAQTKTILEQQQRALPFDSSVAHTLGLMCYWEALQADSELRRTDLFRAVIGNWALVLDDDEYWKQWSAERSAVYQAVVDDKAIQSARQSLRDQLQRMFAEASLELEDAFRLETKAVRLLLQASKGHPIKERAPILGPLMAQRLELQQKAGEFVSGLRAPEGEWAEMLGILQQLAEGSEPARGSAAFDARAKRQLMSCFSQLAYPALYLDLKRPRQALDILTQGKCTECGGFRPSASKANHLQFSRICADDCLRFADHNPAYALLPNRAATLWQHAVELAVAAHLLLAEQCLAAAHLDIQATVGHWQDALAMAAVGGDSRHLHGNMTDMSIARAAALEQNGRRDDAILLIEATLTINGDTRLKGRLAQLLTNRGVEEGNLPQWDKAVTDLRRAIDLNPHMHRTRDNFVIALRGYASERYQAGDRATASALLREAIRVLRTALAGDPANADLQSRLFECEMELSTVSHMDAASADNPLAALLALLGDLAEQADVQADTSAASGTEVTSLTQSERLRRSAAEKLILQNFEGAVADLEEALRLSPADNRIKRALADALEKQADDLVIKHQYEHARSVAERGLGYAPGHSGLQSTLVTIRLFAPRMEPPHSPPPPAEPEEEKPAGGLRGFLGRIFGGKDKSAPLAAGNQGRDVLRACLRSTDLKFQETRRGDFLVPFSTENIGRLIVRTAVVDDHVTLAAPQESRFTDEAMALHSLLGGTFEADHYKLCRRGGSLSLESQIPARLATGAMLENAVHRLAKLVDVPASVLNSSAAFARHVAELQAEVAVDYLMSGPSFQRDTERTTRQVADLVRSTGARHLSTDRNRVRLAFGVADLKVQVVCKGQAAIAIAYMNDMSPGESNLRLMRRMAEINAEMIVCKIALDDDDDAAFMYHMPAVDESVFRQMRERMEEYVMRYGFELTMLA